MRIQNLISRESLRAFTVSLTLLLGLPVITFLSAKTAHSATKPLTIVIDPGHGGSDHGATNDTVKESEVVLEISRLLAKQLGDESKYKIILTRDSNKAVELRQRSYIANRAKADLFVSIHANSSTSPNVRGAEFYIASQMPPDEESMFLADRENTSGEKTSEIESSEEKGPNPEVSAVKTDLEAILEDLKRSHCYKRSLDLARAVEAAWKTSFPGRKASIQQGPFAVLLSTLAPSLLIEVAYVSNASESKELISEKSRVAMATAIAKGIESFIASPTIENIDKSTTQSHIDDHAYKRP
jgi:N-acetylmuramoyl-L-alanine amidase